MVERQKELLEKIRVLGVKVMIQVKKITSSAVALLDMNENLSKHGKRIHENGLQQVMEEINVDALREIKDLHGRYQDENNTNT